MIPWPDDTVSEAISQIIVARLHEVEGTKRVDEEADGDPDVFPSHGLYEGDWIALERESGLIRWQMTLTVEGYVERGKATDARADRSKFHAATVQAVMQDDTLGGLVELIEPADLRKFTAKLANKRRMMFAQDFNIQFVTFRTNPALPA